MTLRKFEDDIIGTADANGNGTFLWRGMTGEWASVLIIASGLAFPGWLINLNGNPVAVGRGPRAPLMLPVLAPGDLVQLVVSGAQPGAAIRGHVWGYASDRGIDDLPIAAPMSTLVAADIAPPVDIQLWDTTSTATPGTASLPTIAAGANNQNFLVNIPPNARALRILAVNATQGSTAAFTYSMRAESSAPFQSPPFIAGAVLTLWPQGAGPGVLKAPLSPGTPVYIPLEPTWGLLTGAFTKPQVKLIITGDPNVALQFFISAMFDVESVDITAQQPLTVNPGSTFTVQEGASPPLWQAPQKRVYAEVGGPAPVTVTLQAGVVNQMIRVFGWGIDVDSVNNISIAFLEDDTTVGVGARFAAFSVDGVRTSCGALTGEANGAPLDGTGHGLRLNLAAGFGGAGASGRAWAYISQG